MNRLPAYRPFQIGIRDLLALMVIVAAVAGASKAPPSPLHVFPVLVAIYTLKLRIVHLRTSPRVTWLVYLGCLLAMVPYLYARAGGDWEGIGYPLPDWVGATIIVFMVPTASFLRDLISGQCPAIWLYVVRSFVEITAIFPLLLLVCWGIGGYLRSLWMY